MTRARGIAIGAGVLILITGLFLVRASGVHLIRGEHIRIENGDVTLQATLALPRWHRGPHPAAVVVHGSGRVARRDVRGYARRLASRGMAVLMYDKRGVGRSTGAYRVAGVANSVQLFDELASDVLAAVRYVGQRDDIDAERVGLIGGSQAGWIMPLAASRSPEVGFMVVISGPLTTYGEEEIYSQLTGDRPRRPGDPDDAEIEARVRAYSGPHGFDPIPLIEALEIPVLWLLGGRDRSVPTFVSMENFRRITAERAKPFEVEYYPGGDHSLRDADTGKRIDYWPRVYDWLQTRDMLRGIIRP